VKTITLTEYEHRILMNRLKDAERDAQAGREALESIDRLLGTGPDDSDRGAVTPDYAASVRGRVQDDLALFGEGVEGRAGDRLRVVRAQARESALQDALTVACRAVGRLDRAGSVEAKRGAAEVVADLEALIKEEM
jgi:hypothetical protein